MMLVATAILQTIFLLMAIAASLGGNIEQTVLFCALMICEEISAQHQQDRKARMEAPHG